MKQNDNNYNHNDKTKEKSDSSHKSKKSSSRKMNNTAPNKTLFLQSLPRDATTDEITRLFMAFPGFIGVNLIENKPGIGFAEFDDTYNSSNAQRSLNGFSIRGQEIVVQFAQ